KDFMDIFETTLGNIDKEFIEEDNRLIKKP
ncbi:transcriptional regulator Hpr, partial [Gottfriedia acidiceleris]